MNAHKPFFICGYSFQNELGFQRDGSSFGLGHPIGAGSALLAGVSKGDSVPFAVVSKGGGAALAGRIQRNRRFHGTRLCPQSLVCYTFGDRGWLKGVVRGRNKHFPSATEQANSASSRTRSPRVCTSRIRLFGCRWCREMERRSAGSPRNGAASPGEPKVYQTRRSDVTLCSRHCIPLHTLSSRNLPRYPWQRMPSCSFCRASGWKSHPPA